MLTIDLPWPSPKLSPNARLHWATKAKEVKKARAQAYAIALGSINSQQAREWVSSASKSPLAFRMTLFPPDKRRRDDDNTIASCKAFRDGIAEALCIDDSLFELRVRKASVVKKGLVRVDIFDAKLNPF